MDIEGAGDFADGFSFFNEMAREGALSEAAVWAGAPKGTPRAWAARRPSSVRVAISERSNSAMPAKTVSTVFLPDSLRDAQQLGGGAREAIQGPGE